MSEQPISEAEVQELSQAILEMVPPVAIKWCVVTTEEYDTCVGAVTLQADFETSHIKASTKWDGCTNIWIADDDGDGVETCYHHICDLDAFIAALQSLREKARAYFGGEFCIATLNEEDVRQKIAEFRTQESEQSR